jgi:hypothetical protein
MATKYTNIFKIYPNWEFWFENMPSGNPDNLGRFPKGNVRSLLLFSLTRRRHQESLKVSVLQGGKSFFRWLRKKISRFNFFERREREREIEKEKERER